MSHVSLHCGRRAWCAAARCGGRSASVWSVRYVVGRRRRSTGSGRRRRLCRTAIARASAAMRRGASCCCSGASACAGEAHRRKCWRRRAASRSSGIQGEGGYVRSCCEVVVRVAGCGASEAETATCDAWPCISLGLREAVTSALR
eukprot:5888096-Pleurochrysis_carterae.AAC.1